MSLFDPTTWGQDIASAWQGATGQPATIDPTVFGPAASPAKLAAAESATSLKDFNGISGPDIQSVNNRMLLYFEQNPAAAVNDTKGPQPVTGPLDLSAAGTFYTDAYTNGVAALRNALPQVGGNIDWGTLAIIGGVILLVVILLGVLAKG